MRLTPSFSASSPLSTFRKGMTPRSSHRKAGTGFACAWPSIVPSKRIAAITLAAVKVGAVMMRTRISCMKPEHFGIAAVGTLGDAVEAQRTGRRSAALVKCGDEAVLARDLSHHPVICYHRYFLIDPTKEAEMVVSGGFY